jgi:hypothetical protein
MSQSVFFFNCWNEDGLACFVPAFAFVFNGDCCCAASAYTSFTKSVIGHIVQIEFKQVLIVQFALFIFFAIFSPIDVSAVEGCFLFVFQLRQVQLHSNCSVIAVGTVIYYLAVFDMLVEHC